MRALLVALIGVVLFSGVILNPEPTIPTVAANSVSIKEVLREGNALIVNRPVDARENALSSVFVVTDNGGTLRRVAVHYGRISGSLIEIESGLSPGDRIIVSEMTAWDAFERIRIRSR